MATSGSYTYAITRDQLIAAAFSLMGVYNDDAPAPQSAINGAAQALNLMIKTWMTKNYNLWCVEDIPIPNVQGQTQYLLGPGNVTAFATYRPLRITMGRLRQIDSGTPYIEVPLIELSRQEYTQMGQKQAQGIVNSYYYDPQTLQGVLYLYLTPNEQANIAIMTVQRPIMDMLNGTDSFDFPIEWLNALKFGLANELSFDYDIPAQKAQRIAQKADKMLEDLCDWDQEDASTYFSPNSRLNGGGYGR